jgi:hypothetical protein
MRNFAFALFISCLIWIFYLALEPFLRRLWPELIVSWVRLLDGRFRDPLVGRDVLFGLLAGVGNVLLFRFLQIGPAWVGLIPLRPDQGGPPPEVELATLRGLRHGLGMFFALQAVWVLFPLGFLILLLLCRLVLRRSKPAIVAFVVLMSVTGINSTSNLYLDLLSSLVFSLLFVFVLFRCGLLAIVVSGISLALLAVFPMTFDAGAWYAGSTFLGLAGFAALALYGFRTALAGRPLLGGAIDPDA